MNAPVINALISPDEVARRRETMAEAVWSARMEGLGKPTEEEVELSELWITGQITHDELRQRTKKLVADTVRELGN
ncbi:hypothetical protein PhaeoP80_04528 (plasmid) [Phaeobacter inhibens]|nr:hypothetical protein PhaeoP80_04528 [Phaeobacter inhibens]